MERDRALALLQRQLDRLSEAASAGRTGGEITTWLQTTSVVLHEVFGATHGVVSNFSGINWSLRSGDVVSGFNPQAAAEELRDQRFPEAVERYRGVLLSAIEIVADFGPPVDEPELAVTAVDTELWQSVEALVRADDWPKVASQTAIFVESKLREWAGLGPDLFGRDLITEILRPATGVFRLGQTASEEQGWLQFGLGLVGALANVDRHRIQDRPDAKQYAMGVLGAGSLLLTQLRFEHGNRFRIAAGTKPTP